MHYTTIMLRLIEDRPAYYRRLRETGIMPETLERLALELKTCHQKWKEKLSREHPGVEPSIASEAMELAIDEMVLCLPSESETDDSDGPTLEGAMAYLKRHTPPK